MSDDEGLLKRVEEFLHVGEPGPETVAPADPAADMVAEGGPADEIDETAAETAELLADGPKGGWTVPPVPTDPNEAELLAEAFGEPDVDGIYGPRGNA